MKISIIGAGAMGGAFAEGLLAGEYILPADITLANPTAKKLEPFAQLGASVTTDNKAATHGADIVSLFVKPWMVEKVLKEIKDALDYSRQTLVICAAGISSAQLAEWLDKGDGTLPPFFLIMPNTAIAVRQSMTFIVPFGATAAQVETVQALLNDVGQTYLTEERMLSAGSALAGCGIAFIMRYIRAASEGGVEMGFKAKEAQAIVQQTMKGAVELLKARGTHPEEEIDKVTTPGGYTIRGLNEMEHAGFTSAVIRGLKATL